MVKVVPLDERDFRANLTRAARSLSPRELGIGKAWYVVARGQLQTLAKLHDLSLETAAYAAAALSPGTTWIETLDALVQLCRAKDEGRTGPPMGRGRYATRDRPKAWAILKGAPPAEHCKGIKVEAFAANLLGDLDRVAVDRHVVRAAVGHDGVDQLSTRQTIEVQNAMTTVARVVLHIRPAEFQAALWAARTGAR